MKMLLLLASLHVAPDAAYEELNKTNQEVERTDTMLVTPGIAVRADNGLTGMVYQNSFEDVSFAGMYSFKEPSLPNTYWNVGFATGYKGMAGATEDGVVPMLGVYHVFNVDAKVRPVLSVTLPGIVSFGMQF